MAYATLLSVTQSLEHILHPNDQSLVPQEIEQHIMRSLNKKATLLLSFLENESVKSSDSNLESRIRDVAYKAEAMICFSHQNYEGSQKLVEELNSISEDVVKMKERNQLVENLLPPTKSLPSASQELGSTVHKTDIVGLHEEMMEIKDRLTRSPSRREIVSIIGMPGIGKTTLTKTLYDDPLIVKHFDVRAWITVSAYYNMQQILIGLLDSIQNNHEKDHADLATLLHKTLKGRRYLIVMDDVWDTNAWDQVKRVFPNDDNGSRVILTTRLQKVADHVECPDLIYSLSLLSSNDSWKLLCQKAFNAEPCPREFEDVGKEIANNCKGLPLSLAVIGGILYKAERTLDYWRYVAQNVNSALNVAHDVQVMNILSLSYKHLHHHLRACFLYMGVLPEDHAISKSKLIRLWVAEGFINPDPSKSLEEVAHEYLENLIDRNMILVLDRNYAGEIKKCGIHDLMRDLCMRIAEEERFLKVVNSQLIQDYQYNFRHVYMHLDGHNNFFAGVYGFLTNSLVDNKTESPDTDLLSRLLNSHQLRVLDAKENPFSKFQDATIGLRYISFCCRGKIYEVHSSICKLLNLQTFVITSRTKVILPLEIWRMPLLRHIKTKECFLPNYPCDITPLENLQTLKGVTNFIFREDSIRMMPNLKKLRIIFELDMGADLSPYCIENLVLLRKLEVLNVSIKGKSKYPLQENFSFPPTLRKLTLTGFGLPLKHMASMGSLQHLEELNLKWFCVDDSVWEPTEGEFENLKSLSISHTDLEWLIADEANFPSLQSLRIINCWRLMEIPLGFVHIHTLGLIEVHGCTKSAMDSVELIRKEQQDSGNERLRIQDSEYMSKDKIFLEEAAERFIAKFQGTLQDGLLSFRKFYRR